MTEPGNWLLVSTSEGADMVATQLTDALKMHDAQSTTLTWRLHSDHEAAGQRLREQFESRVFSGLVVLTGGGKAVNRE